MCMCGRDHDPLRGESRGLLDLSLGGVAEFAWDQAAVEHAEAHSSFPIVEDQAAGVQRVVCLVGFGFEERAVDDHRPVGGGDVDREGSGAEKLLSLSGGRAQVRGELKGKDG